MTDKEGKSEEKHVDEDWKERARHERESLSDAEASTQKTAPLDEGAVGAEAEPAAGEEGPGERPAGGQLPPPSFLGLVAGMGAQASICLGVVENPLTGKVEKDLEAAKHVVDTLGMLKEKTEGNLTEAESAYLDDLLYGLRMQYVEKKP